jgi:hypothetical protein
MAKRLASGKCILTDLGLEKRCPKCDSYWPMDTKFWFASKTEDGLFAWCRACYTARRWPNGRGRTIAAEVTTSGLPPAPFRLSSEAGELAAASSALALDPPLQTTSCKELAWMP